MNSNRYLHNNTGMPLLIGVLLFNTVDLLRGKGKIIIIEIKNTTLYSILFVFYNIIIKIISCPNAIRRNDVSSSNFYFNN